MKTIPYPIPIAAATSVVAQEPHRVKEVESDPSSSNPLSLISTGNLLLFSANDGLFPAALWKTDGTETGTLRVQRNSPVVASPVLAINNTLYFVGGDDLHGAERWKGDGTELGTIMSKDINAGPERSVLADHEFTALNGKLYFEADDGLHGPNLEANPSALCEPGEKVIFKISAENAGDEGTFPLKFIKL